MQSGWKSWAGSNWVYSFQTHICKDHPDLEGRASWKDECSKDCSLYSEKDEYLYYSEFTWYQCQPWYLMWRTERLWMEFLERNDAYATDLASLDSISVNGTLSSSFSWQLGQTTWSMSARRWVDSRSENIFVSVMKEYFAQKTKRKENYYSFAVLILLQTSWSYIRQRFWAPAGQYLIPHFIWPISQYSLLHAENQVNGSLLCDIFGHRRKV